MKHDNLLYFIGEYISPECAKALEDGKVSNINLNTGSGVLNIEAVFDYAVDDDIIVQAQNEAAETLGIKRVIIDAHYAPGVFSKDSLKGIIRVLKAEQPSINGFLDKAIFDISETEININVPQGGEILSDIGIEKLIEDYIDTHYYTGFKVKIAGNNSYEYDSPEYVQMQKERVLRIRLGV